MSDRKIIHINLRDLILLGVGLLILCLLIPPLFKIVLGVAAVALILYAVRKIPSRLAGARSAGEIISKVRLVRRYADADFVEVRPVLIEVGKGEMFAKIGRQWVRMLELEEEIPENVRSLVRGDEIVLVETGNKKYVVVRHEDPEIVEEKLRVLCTLLESSNVRFRLVNSEEAIRHVLSIFRM